jgi:2',3'-cyclic-nucleotide 2'-phosphodiesterase (5'-nucleotidase family)
LPATAVALILPALTALVSSCAPALAPAAEGGSAAPDTMSLVLLGTTDVHGRLYNHDYYTGAPTDHGLALLKPVIDSVRRSQPRPHAALRFRRPAAGQPPRPGARAQSTATSAAPSSTP